MGTSIHSVSPGSSDGAAGRHGGEPFGCPGKFIRTCPAGQSRRTVVLRLVTGFRHDVARGTQIVFQPPGRRVRHVNSADPQPAAPDQRREVQRGGHRFRIRPHQSAGPEEDPAEIADDDGADVAEVGHPGRGLPPEQRFQHRETCGAGRLAVVVGALHVPVRRRGRRRSSGAGRRGIPGAVRPAQRPGGVLVAGTPEHGDEPGPLDLDLVAELRPGGKGGVGSGPAFLLLHRQSIRAWPTRQGSLGERSEVRGRWVGPRRQGSLGERSEVREAVGTSLVGC